MYSGRLVDMYGKPLRGPVTLKVQFVDGPVNGNVALDINGIFAIALKAREGEAGQIAKAFNDHVVFIQIEETHLDIKYPAQRFTAPPYALRVPVDNVTIRFNDKGQLEAIGGGGGGEGGTPGAT